MNHQSTTETEHLIVSSFQKEDTSRTAGITRTDQDLTEIAEGILLDTQTDLSKANTHSMPMAQIAALGAGVASLIPVFHTVTQTMTIDTQGLYQLANAGVGDVLKMTRSGNFWGALKTSDGASRMAQLKAAGPLTAKNTVAVPVSPAIIMMAVALFSIEQKLDSIAEIQKQILSFLETEKQSEIEADVETLSGILTKYKHNWDNEHFIASNHKLVLDIQRTARKNMFFYQKAVTDMLAARQLLVTQAKVNLTLNEMQRTFRYYRLALYSFAMASLIEIMLSGNFKEENITGMISEIEKRSMEYRDIFMQCSVYLEKISGLSVKTNVLKSAGTAGKAVGKLIGSIPIVKKGPVDEYLLDRGTYMQKNAQVIGQDILASFATISNPGTGIFIEKMKDMIQIYNHTSQICFDDKRVYLVAG